MCMRACASACVCERAFVCLMSNQTYQSDFNLIQNEGLLVRVERSDLKSLIMDGLVWEIGLGLGFGLGLEFGFGFSGFIF